MQNTLPLTPGNPLRNVTGLARQIALPGEHAPLRFPSFPAVERTAVMAFNQPATLNLPPATPVAVAQFRQAVYPTWADVSGVYCSYATYLMNMNTGVSSTVGDSTFHLPSDAVVNVGCQNRAATNLPGVVGSTTLAKYGVMGTDRGAPGPDFVYIAPNTSVAVVIAQSVTVTNVVGVQALLETWVAPGEIRDIEVFGSTVALGNTGCFQQLAAYSTEGYWMRVKSLQTTPYAATVSLGGQFTVTLMSYSGTATYAPSSTNGNAGTVTIVPATVTSFVPLVIASEFANSTLPWMATRVTASAFLGTNVSQVLNKGGTILAGRLSPAIYNPWRNSQTAITNLHPAEKAYLPLEMGVYTYCPPSTDMVFFGDYTANVDSQLGGTVAPTFLLSNDSMYNKMYITATAVAETLATTTSFHIEFRTSSALWQIGLSAMTLESLHSAQLVLADAGFFFENWTHDSILGKVIAGAKKFVPQMIAVVNPAAGKLAKQVLQYVPEGKSKTIVPKAGPSKPMTTTAKNSGMLGPNEKKKRAYKVVVKKRASRRK